MKTVPPAEQQVGLRRKAELDVDTALDTAKNLIFSDLWCESESGQRPLVYFWEGAEGGFSSDFPYLTLVGSFFKSGEVEKATPDKHLGRQFLSFAQCLHPVLSRVL